MSRFPLALEPPLQRNPLAGFRGRKKAIQGEECLERVLTTGAIGARLIADKDMECAKCGEPMRMTEKDTFSGRDMREYQCSRCGYTNWEDRGTALWQILSDDREEYEARKAEQEAAQDEAELEEAKQAAASTLWGRFLALFGRAQKGK
jgi:ribosomal protein S27AE